MPRTKGMAANASGLSRDQTLLLQKARHNERALREKIQDKDREIAHLREQNRELSLDYQHVIARLWHINSAMGR